MKKLLSVFLSALMLLAALVPSVCAVENENVDKVPVVYLRGDGNGIVDKEQNIVFPVNYDAGQLPDSVAAVVFPHLINALLFGKWDAYFDAFEAEVRPVFEKCSLDENGDATNGTDISIGSYKENAINMNTDKANEDGEYWLYDYTFWYDWRRDPLEIADSLNTYIKTLKETTGVDKVAIVGKCLGGSFVLAYLAKYGYDDIRSIAFDATVGNGSEKFSETYGGKIKFDGEAFERHQIDSQLYEGDAADDYLDEFIIATLDLLNETDKLDVTEKLVDMVYKKLYQELTPRLGMAVYGSWPGYWSSVTAEDYAAAKKLVFGEEGSAYSEKYAGLIKKLDNYDVIVRQRIPEILKNAKEAGVNVGIVAKYGYQMTPFIESCDELGDSLVSVNKASFGATCSKVTDTLSDEYINERMELGLGKYISPDKQIDASTCLFPDYTWFIKGIHHDTWAADEDQIIYNICTAKRQYTVNTEPDTYPQFLVYDAENGYCSIMTEDNNNVTNWDAEEIEEHNIFNYFKAVRNFFEKFFAMIKVLLFGNK